jgi:hypothetical protein
LLRGKSKPIKKTLFSDAADDSNPVSYVFGALRCRGGTIGIAKHKVPPRSL